MFPMASAVSVSQVGAVFEIVLDRPKVNAIDAATSRELNRVFTDFRDDPTLRVAIISGAGGKVFSAGWDINAGANLGEDEGGDFGAGGFAGVGLIWEMNKPVIAAVNGIAVGGGFEMALACDLVVAAEHAAFSLPETSLGVMADAGGVQRLPRRVPRNVALEMLYTGRRMSAAEDEDWGLVNRVVAADQLWIAARQYAEMLVAGAPLSVAAIKEVVRETEKLTEQEAFRAVRKRQFPTYDTMLNSSDRIEGPRAFVEKRKPVWRGL
jgi:crotonobetainyl-CoA hydratase